MMVMTNNDSPHNQNQRNKELRVGMTTITTITILTNRTLSQQMRDEEGTTPMGTIYRAGVRVPKLPSRPRTVSVTTTHVVVVVAGMDTVMKPRHHPK
jgi:hypothetical protein